VTAHGGEGGGSHERALNHRGDGGQAVGDAAKPRLEPLCRAAMGGYEAGWR
jgi:hypothetical protein